MRASHLSKHRLAERDGAKRRCRVPQHAHQDARHEQGAPALGGGEASGGGGPADVRIGGDQHVAPRQAQETARAEGNA